MSRNTAQSLDDELDPSLAEAVAAIREEPLPQAVIDRMVFNALRLESASPLTNSGKGKRFIWLVPPLVLALSILVLFGFWSRPSRTLLAEEVQQAIATRPWLYITGTGRNESRMKIWYSPKEDILASQKGDDIVFFDPNHGTMEVYAESSPKNISLSRIEIDPDTRKLLLSQQRTIETLFFGDPTQAFRDGPVKLIRQEQRTIEINGQCLIEIRFTTSTHGDQPNTITKLHIEPQSKLPIFWETYVGRVRIFSGQVEYPASGPKTIYALGVPTDLPIADLRPTEELKQILETLQTNRARFDTYRAIVVNSNSRDPKAHGMLAHQVWRKGAKWRVELLRIPSKEMAPPADIDPATWWLAQGRRVPVVPQLISDGQREIRLKAVPAQPQRPDPQNPDFLLIESIESDPTATFGPYGNGDPSPGEPDYFPDFQTYPVIHSTKLAKYHTAVNAELANRARSLVCVESLDRSPTDKPGAIRGTRYWMDRERNYATVKVEWLKNGEPANSPRDWIEMSDFALSPSGLPYPRLIRNFQNSRNLTTGKLSDSFNHFFLDFDENIPDSLFKTDGDFTVTRRSDRQQHSDTGRE